MLIKTIPGDPCVGTVKALVFTYEIVGQSKSVSLSEDQKIELGIDRLFRNSGCHQPPAEVSHFNLAILQATYGVSDRYSDVTGSMCGLVAQQGRAPFCCLKQ
jgi:hypothetical protein